MILSVLKDELTALGVPYEFMRWTSENIDLYFVGEYSETVPTTEEGSKEISLILTGTTKQSFLVLEEFRELIESHFDPIDGFRKSIDGDSAAIFYENAFPIPTGDANLKRIQINLRGKEWRCRK